MRMPREGFLHILPCRVSLQNSATSRNLPSSSIRDRISSRRASGFSPRSVSVSLERKSAHVGSPPHFDRPAPANSTQRLLARYLSSVLGTGLWARPCSPAPPFCILIAPTFTTAGVLALLGLRRGPPRNWGCQCVPGIFAPVLGPGVGRGVDFEVGGSRGRGSVRGHHGDQQA